MAKLGGARFIPLLIKNGIITKEEANNVQQVTLTINYQYCIVTITKYGDERIERFLEDVGEIVDP